MNKYRVLIIDDERLIERTGGDDDNQIVADREDFGGVFEGSLGAESDLDDLLDAAKTLEEIVAE